MTDIERIAIKAKLDVLNEIIEEISNNAIKEVYINAEHAAIDIASMIKSKHADLSNILTKEEEYDDRLKT